MPHDVLEKHPDAERLYGMDFTDELPDDTSVTAGSSVSAVDANGTAAASVVGTVSQAGMTLNAVLQAGTNGQDYLVTFTGRGNTSARDAVKQLEMRVRTKMTGSV